MVVSASASSASYSAVHWFSKSSNEQIRASTAELGGALSASRIVRHAAFLCPLSFFVANSSFIIPHSSFGLRLFRFPARHAEASAKAGSAPAAFCRAPAVLSPQRDQRRYSAQTRCSPCVALRAQQGPRIFDKLSPPTADRRQSTAGRFAVANSFAPNEPNFRTLRSSIRDCRGATYRIPLPAPPTPESTNRTHQTSTLENLAVRPPRLPLQSAMCNLQFSSPATGAAAGQDGSPIFGFRHRAFPPRRSARACLSATSASPSSACQPPPRALYRAISRLALDVSLSAS